MPAGKCQPVKKTNRSAKNGSESGGNWQIVHRSFDAFGLQNSFPYEADGTKAEFKGDLAAAHLLAAPILYAGGEWDEHAQLYVLGGRFYDPYSGRWVTDGGSENGYKFGDNNPVRERVIGETVYSGMFEDYSYYLNPLNNDLGLVGTAFGVGKALGWTAFAVGSAGAGIISGAGLLTTAGFSTTTAYAAATGELSRGERRLHCRCGPLIPMPGCTNMPSAQG